LVRQSKPIFFVRHLRSDSNSDNEKRAALNTPNWRIQIDQKFLGQLDISAILNYIAANPDAKFVIVPSPFDRTVDTAVEIKKALGKKVLGIKTWKELVEFKSGSEIRLNEAEVGEIYGSAHEAHFYSRMLRKTLDSHSRPIDGESFNELFGRTAVTAQKMLQMNAESSLAEIGVQVEDVVPIYVGHCWNLNGIFSAFGLMTVRNWRETKTIKNAFAIEVHVTEDGISSPNLSAALVQKSILAH
jgi:broad specificity phosphatase PhoE